MRLRTVLVSFFIVLLSQSFTLSPAIGATGKELENKLAKSVFEFNRKAAALGNDAKLFSSVLAQCVRDPECHWQNIEISPSGEIVKDLKDRIDNIRDKIESLHQPSIDPPEYRKSQADLDRKAIAVENVPVSLPNLPERPQLPVERPSR